jgi:uncharacterized protein YutD
MLRSRKNVGKYQMACYFGCCRNVLDKTKEKRIMKRKENREWKKESNDY